MTPNPNPSPELHEAAYLIRKGGYFYRPNAQGYTTSKAEAGRYTLAEAWAYSHPNGPTGPRDGMDYMLAEEPAAPKCSTCDGTKVVSQGGHDTGCNACYVSPQTLPAPGEVGFPDIGPDPLKGDRADRIEQSVAACREAYVKQQKGVPDQTALVWRWHLGALLECATRLKAILARDSSATVAAANDEAFARGVEAAAKVAERWISPSAELTAPNLPAAIRLLSQGEGK